MKPSEEPEGVIPVHGGYRNLKSFQVARLAYDVTVRFCERYVEKRSRTHDQMVQAARSGVQNIAEGSQASGTSKKTELKLTNVARASLEELRLDYEDFLRQRGLALWPREDRRRADLIARRPGTADDVAAWARDMHDGQNGRGGQGGLGAGQKSMGSTVSMVSTYPEIAANGALALIAVACSLLTRQLAAQEKAFVEEGGFTEALPRAEPEAYWLRKRGCFGAMIRGFGGEWGEGEGKMPLSDHLKGMGIAGAPLFGLNGQVAVLRP